MVLVEVMQALEASQILAFIPIFMGLLKVKELEEPGLKQEELKASLLDQLVLIVS